MVRKIFLVLAFIVIAFFTFIYYGFRPTPNHLRNKGKNGVKIEADILSDFRSPIVLTYTREEYDKLIDEDIIKENSKIIGNIEGDAACSKLYKDDRIIFSFTKDGKEVKATDTKIKIQVVTSLWRETEILKEFKDELKQVDGKYCYRLKFYGDDPYDYGAEVLKISVFYKIDNKEYVSVFALNQLKENED